MYFAYYRTRVYVSSNAASCVKGVNRLTEDKPPKAARPPDSEIVSLIESPRTTKRGDIGADSLNATGGVLLVAKAHGRGV